jgi:hypothetical protein
MARYAIAAVTIRAASATWSGVVPVGVPKIIPSRPASKNACDVSDR